MFLDIWKNRQIRFLEHCLGCVGWDVRT